MSGCGSEAFLCASSDLRPAILLTSAFLPPSLVGTRATQITGPREAPAVAKQHEGYTGITIGGLEVPRATRASRAPRSFTACAP